MRTIAPSFILILVRLVRASCFVLRIDLLVLAMQLTSLLTLLALAGSGPASPTKRVPGVQVQELSALRADSNGKLQFAVQDPETQLSDNCTVSWYILPP